jgi:hypothetical protein
VHGYNFVTYVLILPDSAGHAPTGDPASPKVIFHAERVEFYAYSRDQAKCRKKIIAPLNK